MRWKEGYNLDYLIEYDESNPISIEKYAQRLIGKTFADGGNKGQFKLTRGTNGT